MYQIEHESVHITVFASSLTPDCKKGATDRLSGFVTGRYLRHHSSIQHVLRSDTDCLVNALNEFVRTLKALHNDALYAARGCSAIARITIIMQSFSLMPASMPQLRAT